MRQHPTRAIGFWACLFLISTLSSVCFAQISPVATKARYVLKQHCFSCHGEGGSNEGGFNYVLNRKRLVRELVVPGDVDGSKLIERIVKGEMPPDGEKLPAADVVALKKWVEAGAPAFATEVQRPFITQEDMLGAMLNDLEKATERDRPFYRYFTLTHLHNAGFESNELESHRQGLAKLINSLSWGRDIKVPVPVDTAKTVLRIDLRHYKWNEADAWNRIIAADPYRVTYSFAAATKCYAHTQCELPHVRADWFVFSASRPPLYHVILDLPDTPAKFLLFEKEKLGVDVASNLRDYSDVIRAGFFPSGVSKSNRLIERHVSSYGAYWKSYDFKPADAKQPKRQNLKAYPTGPDGPNGFEHDGGEMIFSLPNGLQGYLLTDNKGQRINKGPTDVVVDKEAVKRGRDPEVVNGVSCMNCHWSGMLNKVDQIRDHLLAQPTAYTASVTEFVKAVYVEKPVFAEKLQEDRARFAAAVKKCGLSGLAKSEPVATLAFQFDEPLDIDLAAAEAGVAPSVLNAALKSSKALGRELGSLTLGQPVPRSTYIQQFSAVIRELKMGSVSPQPGASMIVTIKGIDFVFHYCPQGNFRMGSPLREKRRDDDEAQVDVTINKGFWILETEVTQGMWTAVMGTTIKQQAAKTSSSSLYGVSSKYPIHFVSHGDATEFCVKLNGLLRSTSGTVKLSVRLPSEAEWEYAARAGTRTRFYWGDDESRLGDYAWFTGNSNGGTQPVGQKKGNAWGLKDMSGNVWEWCADWYGEKLPGGSNPRGPSSGLYRVFRGGSWADSMDDGDQRSAERYRLSPGDRSSAVGFRIICNSAGS